MKVKNIAVRRLIFLAVLLCFSLSACIPSGTAVKSGAATQAPEAEATAVLTQTLAPTNTPLPPTATSTATLTATAAATATATAAPTATPNRAATAEARATAAADALLQQIEPELKEYNFALTDGHLAWSSKETYEVTARTYNDFQYTALEEAGSLSNFVFHTEITWDTSMGFAGCGILFRAEEDLQKGRQNHFALLRLENAPAWDMEFRQKFAFQYFLQKWAFTNSIFDKARDTNAITLVVNGQNILAYINGRKTHLVEDTKLKEGGFALTAWQESGETTCTFDNTWIWVIDQP